MGQENFRSKVLDSVYNNEFANRQIHYFYVLKFVVKEWL